MRCNIQFLGLCAGLALMLTACQEPYYRDVPASQWQQLTPEQKSLIIDQAYDADMNQGGTTTFQTPIGTFKSPRENSHDPVMPTLHPTVQMTTHSKMPATLVWQIGTMDVGVNTVTGFYGASSRSYNKAQQAVFMTSLQQTLQQQQAFAAVNLVTQAPTTTSQPVITVYFKSTRVADDTDGNQITLSTVLRIQAPQQTEFTRTYVVSSTPNQSFSKQEEDVSTRLLDKVLQGIDDWAANTNNKK